MSSRLAVVSPTLEARLWAKVDKRGPAECWPWLASKDSCGYGKISYGCDADGKQILVGAHRAAWIVVHGRIPLPGLVVRHRCDNPECCNPAHLEIGTHQDNVGDRTARGRHCPAFGLRNGKAKLTGDDVREIRAMRAAGHVQQAIAERFHVDRSNVGQIVNRKTWRHVG